MDGHEPHLTSIPHLFAWRAMQRPNAVALFIKRDGKFHGITWQEIDEDISRAADALATIGIQAGNCVVQVAENRYEWLIADLAIQSLGAIHVPIHASLTVPQQTDQARDSQPSGILVQRNGDSETPCVAQGLPDIPALCYEGEPNRRVGLWSSALHDAVPERGRQRRADALPNIQASSIATILYTSGTTGEPKGVVLTQGNIVFNAVSTARVFAACEDELRLNFLPLSHIFARTCDMYTWLVCGCQLALAESRETIVDDCQTMQPHFLNAVPYFFERTMRTLRGLGIADQPGILRKALGGRLRLCCSGGAPLPDMVFDYFASQEVPLLQGYGLTETAPVITVNAPDTSRRGSVGRPLPGVDVEIAPDGEIRTRGPHVMPGYWRKPDATNEVLRGGWFSTGDIGRIDDDGFVWITGRKKEILVTAGGKKIAPALVESLLNQDPLIAQSMVLGDGQKYLAALIVPDVGQLEERLLEAGRPANTWQTVPLDPLVRQWYEDVIHNRLTNLSRYEQVQTFCLLTQEFTVSGGELTPKLSLRRGTIAALHADRITQLYAS